MGVIINFLTPYMPLIIIVLVVILASCAMLFISKKFGLKFVNIAQSIVLFVRDTLQALNMNNDRIDNLIGFILQAIAYALTLGTAADIQQRVDAAMDLVRRLSDSVQYNITDAEKVIIRQVFTLTFIFMSSLNIQPNRLNYEKALKSMTRENDKIMAHRW